jgi:hypothetical protein
MHMCLSLCRPLIADGPCTELIVTRQLEHNLSRNHGDGRWSLSTGSHKFEFAVHFALSDGTVQQEERTLLFSYALRSASPFFFCEKGRQEYLVRHTSLDVQELLGSINLR